MLARNRGFYHGFPRLFIDNLRKIEHRVPNLVISSPSERSDFRHWPIGRWIASLMLARTIDYGIIFKDTIDFVCDILSGSIKDKYYANFD